MYTADATREATGVVAALPLTGCAENAMYRSLLRQSETVHHDGLVDGTVDIVAADVGYDADQAIRSLNGAWIVGRSGYVLFLPGLPDGGQHSFSWTSLGA